MLVCLKQRKKQTATVVIATILACGLQTNRVFGLINCVWSARMANGLQNLETMVTYVEYI